MKKTKFYSAHEKANAKIVDFAGYKMPVQYSSIIAEHLAVRNSVGVFDVSHMGEVFVRGEKALDFVQHITINDASLLVNGKVQYSAMCMEDGGIVDDLLVYKISDTEFMLVVNASNLEKDFVWMQKNNKFGVELSNESDEYSLLAVQGPDSNKTLQKITDKKIDLEYYTFMFANVAGIDMILSRTGYTGELGYELYFKGSEEEALKLWDAVMEAGKEFNIQPAGLGCRDSLRLEMGFCLYGNDIDETTNPLEASLGWITKLKKENFIGKEKLLSVKQEGLKRKLVPVISDEKVFPRHGYDITLDGKKIGTVTSGVVSPVIEKAIAMVYLDFPYTPEGTVVNFSVRGKEIPARVTKLPFVKK
ncbi:MAG: glycine cleavage system aminomethyltransferase GcvT [Melioribacteraceae bacterium]|nr:glycine cleavage system aminomethyltransferase GcvT [Melioribacteraceae bacterium]